MEHDTTTAKDEEQKEQEQEGHTSNRPLPPLDETLLPVETPEHEDAWVASYLSFAEAPTKEMRIMAANVVTRSATDAFHCNQEDDDAVLCRGAPDCNMLWFAVCEGGCMLPMCEDHISLCEDCQEFECEACYAQKHADL